MSADSGASGEAALSSEADADERPKDSKSQGDVDGRLMRKDDSGIGSEPADDRPEAPAHPSNGGQESPDSGNQDCAEAGASEPQEAAGTAEKRPTTETEDDSDGFPEEKKQKSGGEENAQATQPAGPNAKVGFGI
ncbi:hypothetical protein MTO96_020537 [Rhipicephalus appendiculatus]